MAGNKYSQEVDFVARLQTSNQEAFLAQLKTIFEQAGKQSNTILKREFESAFRDLGNIPADFVKKIQEQFFKLRPAKAGSIQFLPKVEELAKLGEDFKKGSRVALAEVNRIVQDQFLKQNLAPVFERFTAQVKASLAEVEGINRNSLQLIFSEWQQFSEKVIPFIQQVGKAFIEHGPAGAVAQDHLEREAEILELIIQHLQSISAEAKKAGVFILLKGPLEHFQKEVSLLEEIRQQIQGITGDSSEAAKVLEQIANQVLRLDQANAKPLGKLGAKTPVLSETLQQLSQGDQSYTELFNRLLETREVALEKEYQEVKKAQAAIREEYETTLRTILEQHQLEIKSAAEAEIAKLDAAKAASQQKLQLEKEAALAEFDLANQEILLILRSYAEYKASYQRQLEEIQNQRIQIQTQASEKILQEYQSYETKRIELEQAADTALKNLNTSYYKDLEELGNAHRAKEQEAELAFQKAREGLQGKQGGLLFNLDGIKAATSTLAETWEQFKRGNKTISELAGSVVGLTDALGPVGKGLLATAGFLGLMADAATKATDRTTELAKNQFIIRDFAGELKPETIRAFEIGIERAGGFTFQLQANLQSLSDKLKQAALDASGPAAKALDFFGVEAVDKTTGKVKDMELVLEQLAEHFNATADSAEKSANQVQIFGFFGVGATSYILRHFKELQQAAKDSGTAFEQGKGFIADYLETTRSAALAQQALDAAIAQDFAPVLIELQKVLIEISQILTEIARDPAVKSFFKELTLAMAAIGSGVKDLLRLLGNVTTLFGIVASVAPLGFVIATKSIKETIQVLSALSVAIKKAIGDQLALNAVQAGSQVTNVATAPSTVTTLADEGATISKFTRVRVAGTEALKGIGSGFATATEAAGTFLASLNPIVLAFAAVGVAATAATAVYVHLVEDQIEQDNKALASLNRLYELFSKIRKEIEAAGQEPSPVLKGLEKQALAIAQNLTHVNAELEELKETQARYAAASILGSIVNPFAGVIIRGKGLIEEQANREHINQLLETQVKLGKSINEIAKEAQALALKEHESLITRIALIDSLKGRLETRNREHEVELSRIEYQASQGKFGTDVDAEVRKQEEINRVTEEFGQKQIDLHRLIEASYEQLAENEKKSARSTADAKIALIQKQVAFQKLSAQEQAKIIEEIQEAELISAGANGKLLVEQQRKRREAEFKYEKQALDSRLRLQESYFQELQKLNERSTTRYEVELGKQQLADQKALERHEIDEVEFAKRSADRIEQQRRARESADRGIVTGTGYSSEEVDRLNRALKEIRQEEASPKRGESESIQRNRAARKQQVEEELKEMEALLRQHEKTANDLDKAAHGENLAEFRKYIDQRIQEIEREQAKTDQSTEEGKAAYQRLEAEKERLRRLSSSGTEEELKREAAIYAQYERGRVQASKATEKEIAEARQRLLKSQIEAELEAARKREAIRQAELAKRQRLLNEEKTTIAEQESELNQIDEDKRRRGFSEIQILEQRDRAERDLAEKSRRNAQEQLDLARERGDSQEQLLNLQIALNAAIDKENQLRKESPVKEAQADAQNLQNQADLLTAHNALEAERLRLMGRVEEADRLELETRLKAIELEISGTAEVIASLQGQTDKTNELTQAQVKLLNLEKERLGIEGKLHPGSVGSPTVGHAALGGDSIDDTIDGLKAAIEKAKALAAAILGSAMRGFFDLAAAYLASSQYNQVVLDLQKRLDQKLLEEQQKSNQELAQQRQQLADQITSIAQQEADGEKAAATSLQNDLLKLEQERTQAIADNAARLSEIEANRLSDLAALEDEFRDQQAAKDRQALRDKIQAEIEFTKTLADLRFAAATQAFNFLREQSKSEADLRKRQKDNQTSLEAATKAYTDAQLKAQETKTEYEQAVARHDQATADRLKQQLAQDNDALSQNLEQVQALQKERELLQKERETNLEKRNLEKKRQDELNAVYQRAVKGEIDKEELDTLVKQINAKYDLEQQYLADRLDALKSGDALYLKEIEDLYRQQRAAQELANQAELAALKALRDEKARQAAEDALLDAENWKKRRAEINARYDKELKDQAIALQKHLDQIKANEAKVRDEYQKTLDDLHAKSEEALAKLGYQYDQFFQRLVDNLKNVTKQATDALKSIGDLGKGLGGPPPPPPPPGPGGGGPGGPGTGNGSIGVGGPGGPGGPGTGSGSTGNTTGLTNAGAGGGSISFVFDNGNTSGIQGDTSASLTDAIIKYASGTRRGERITAVSALSGLAFALNPIDPITGEKLSAPYISKFDYDRAVAAIKAFYSLANITKLYDSKRVTASYALGILQDALDAKLITQAEYDSLQPRLTKLAWLDARGGIPGPFQEIIKSLAEGKIDAKTAWDQILKKYYENPAGLGLADVLLIKDFLSEFYGFTGQITPPSDSTGQAQTGSPQMARRQGGGTGGPPAIPSLPLDSGGGFGFHPGPGEGPGGHPLEPGPQLPGKPDLTKGAKLLEQLQQDVVSGRRDINYAAEAIVDYQRKGYITLTQYYDFLRWLEARAGFTHDVPAVPQVPLTPLTQLGMLFTLRTQPSPLPTGSLTTAINQGILDANLPQSSDALAKVIRTVVRMAVRQALQDQTDATASKLGTERYVI